MSDFLVQGIKPVGAGKDPALSSAFLQTLSKADPSEAARGEMAPSKRAASTHGGEQRVNADAQEVAEQMNAVMRMINTRVTFEVNKETGDVVIRLIDTITGQVVREIPPHELRAIAMTLAELAGMLVDKKG